MLILSLFLSLHSPISLDFANIKWGHKTKMCDCRPVLMKVPGKDKEGKDLYLDPDAARAWTFLLERAAKEGYSLEVSYAYRTRQQQKRLRRTMGRWAAKPGKSQHELGLAIGIIGTKDGKRKTELFKWLQHAGPEHGFFNTVPKEPWHWEWIPESKREKGIVDTPYAHEHSNESTKEDSWKLISG